MHICHICLKIQCRFLPIGHFHCALVRHCKLLFANLSRSNLSICYKLPQILKLPQISRRSCIFARAALWHFPLHLLLICPTTSHFCTAQILAEAKLGHKSDALAIQWRTRDQVIKSSATHLNWEGLMQEVRICRISFGGLLQNPLLFVPRHFGRRLPPALQSLFICFPNQNLICLQFNHNILQKWFFLNLCLQEKYLPKIFLNNRKYDFQIFDFAYIHLRVKEDLKWWKVDR